MPTIIFRTVMLVIAVVAMFSSVVAYRSHQPYLGARLLALVGATVPAAVFAERFVAVLMAQSRVTWIVLSVIGALLLCLVGAAVFPRQFVGLLAQLLGHKPGSR